MKHVYVLSRFDGGLNTKATPLHGSPDQSPGLQNVMFDDFGAVETCRGYSALVSAAINSFPIDMLHSYVKNDGTAKLMAFCGNLLYVVSGSTAVTVPSGQSVFSNGVMIQGITFQNQLFMSDGYYQYKYNGAEFTKWGISAPSAATVASSSAGTLTGYYKYVILGVGSNAVAGYRYAEGNYGSATTEVQLTAGRGYVTEIPVFPTSAGVNTKLVCRNTAGASGIYYVVTSITNQITVYEDNNSDSTLATLAGTDNGIPQFFTVFTNHMDRIFGASGTSSNPSYLWYSNINDPEVFGTGLSGTSSGYIHVGQGDGSEITGLATLGNGIIICKNDNKGNGSIYYLFTPDATPTNWTLTKLGTESGGQAVRVMEKFSNYIMYLNRYGIYDLNEAAIGDIRSDALSFNIESEVEALANAYLSKAVAITWKNKVWVSVPSGSVTANNYILQYDFVRGRNEKNRLAGSWAKFTGPAISDFAIHNGTLYGGSSAADGMIYVLDTTYNNNGSAIDSYYKTMLIQGNKGHESHTKVWRYVILTLGCTGDWAMNVTYGSDFEGEAGNIVAVNLDPGAAEWGVAGNDWGVADWGAGYTRKKYRVDFTNMESLTLQLKFSTNTADQYFKVYKAEVFYNLKGVR